MIYKLKKNCKLQNIEEKVQIVCYIVRCCYKLTITQLAFEISISILMDNSNFWSTYFLTSFQFKNHMIAIMQLYSGWTKTWTNKDA